MYSRGTPALRAPLTCQGRGKMDLLWAIKAASLVGTLGVYSHQIIPVLLIASPLNPGLLEHGGSPMDTLNPIPGLSLKEIALRKQRASRLLKNICIWLLSPQSSMLGFCPQEPREKLISLADMYLPNILYKQVTDIIHTPTNYQVTQ